jgi:oxygen-dependent protoporphyrinogen oxidase
MNQDVNTVIIGSGICGLSVAHFLSKKRSDFLVLESSNRAGGIIQTKIEKDFICENGPNTVLLNNEAIEEIIKDHNLWSELQFPKESSNKNRFVLHKNKLTKIPLNPLSFIFSPLFSFFSKIRILKEPFVNTHQENTSVFEFVKKRFGKEFHDQLIEPFITGIYAGNTKKMSARHTLKMLWKLEQTHGSVIKGLLKSKRTKKNKINSFNFPKGLSQLISKITKSMGSQLILNFKVQQIIKHENGYEITSESGKIFCKEIICTVPAYSLKKLIDDSGLVSQLNKIIYSPVDVFHFGFEKKNIQNNKQGFGVLTKPSDGKSYLGILFNSRIFDYVSPADKELFTVLVGGERQKHLCGMEPDKLKKLILEELEDLIGHKGKIVIENHYRWSNGIPQFNLDHIELLNAVEEFENNNSKFHLIGNYFNGVSVSDCIQKSRDLVNIIN